MAGNKRTASERAAHLRTIEQLYRREHKTQAEIAAILKIDQSTVSRDVRVICKRIGKELQKDALANIGMILTRLEYIIDEADAAWRKTKDDPRFLGEQTKAVREMMKALGLDQVSMIDLGGAQNPQVNLIVNRVPSRSEAETDAGDEDDDD